MHVVKIAAVEVPRSHTCPLGVVFQRNGATLTMRRVKELTH